MVNVAFIRNNGRYVKRGYVADVPFGEDINYTKPFIIVSIDETTIPTELYNNSSVRLKLDNLMKQYPNKTVQIEDENGDMVDTIIAGYFHEDGNSKTPYPIITIGDVDYE